jgi:BirA family biotin operon repressor/biotin-[acetyl-CoA-carboxylase] ligase
LDSTSAKAAEFFEHGTVVIANHQTAGRGRYGRSFFSPADSGIYMSLVLQKERIGLAAPTLITAFSAVAVCDALEFVCKKSAQIKWVNDIFLHGRKICGILANDFGDRIILGIGVNFTAPKNVPPELSDKIGAVYGEGENPTATRDELAAAIINELAALDDKPQDFMQKYRARMMFLGEKITVTGANSFAATALDIDDTGRLVVQTENGEILSLSSGEVSII